MSAMLSSYSTEVGVLERFQFHKRTKHCPSSSPPANINVEPVKPSSASTVASGSSSSHLLVRDPLANSLLRQARSVVGDRGALIETVEMATELAAADGIKEIRKGLWEIEPRGSISVPRNIIFGPAAEGSSMKREVSVVVGPGLVIKYDELDGAVKEGERFCTYFVALLPSQNGLHRDDRADFHFERHLE
jgi:hypothetical protein